ncbi:hypothetical protein FF38_11277 [Lucilia cuprina]|uniref:Uncharacterized protein n=1 Tax=Lucilia cuprina TaxID=7375 RepID=A0A0L0BL75_LUCCU|nr:hypothetical protein FF38_11277 [Lucilia cuprina]
MLASSLGGLLAFVILIQITFPYVEISFTRDNDFPHVVDYVVPVATVRIRHNHKVSMRNLIEFLLKRQENFNTVLCKISILTGVVEFIKPVISRHYFEVKARFFESQHYTSTGAKTTPICLAQLDLLQFIKYHVILEVLIRHLMPPSEKNQYGLGRIDT